MKKLTRFKIAIFKKNCSKDRLMELSMVLSYSRLENCQVHHRKTNSFFRKGVTNLHRALLNLAYTIWIVSPGMQLRATAKAAALFYPIISCNTYVTNLATA
jgi:hypothetical protein